ncbi:hypothetical protein K5F04_15055 [Acinetobacter baumannii]|nr:hypothetical protein [Acinetobacter baumannii]
MYEPYPVPEQVREQKLSRYSSLWTFAKQDLRLLLWGCSRLAEVLLYENEDKSL